MRFKTLIINNYGPFRGEVIFDLYKRGLMLVRGDNRDEARMNSNGAGKSSLVEAMDWSLFGVVPRGDVVESVLHNGTRECSVAVTSEDDEGNNVRVVRIRADGKQSVRLYWNDEDVSSLDGRETQRHIEWHLGFDRQVFHSTVLFAQQDMFCFADATDADRMSVLTKILRMEDIDTWLVSAKALRDDARGRHSETSQSLTDVNTRLFMLDAVDPAKQADEWNAQHKVAGEQMRREAEHLRVSALQLPPLPAASIDASPSIDPSSIEKARAAVASADVNLQAAHGLVGSRQSEATRLTRLADLGLVCPECEQDIPPERTTLTQDHLRHARMQLDDARGIVERISAQARDARAVLQKLETTAAAEQARKLAADDNVRRAHKDMHERIQSMAQRLAEHDSQTNPFDVQRRQLQEQKAALQAQQAEARAAKKAAEDALSDYDWWVDALGQRGLKSYVLDARLAEMNEAANHWVRMLTGGSIWVRMENTTTLKSGAQRNKFQIRVFRQEADGSITERNYRSWSGGERRRISLGIDFGLSRLVAQRATKPWSLMVLDEVFRHLDAAGRDAAMQLLQHLREEKETVLVVDHDAEFQSMFEQTITVRKTNGCAVILEGEQADERSAEPVPRRPVGAEQRQLDVAPQSDRPHRRRRVKRTDSDKRA